MTDKINELLRLVEEFKPKAAAEIEEFRIRILGKKGELNALMEEFKTVAPELKRELGQQLNRLKNEATARIGSLREELQNAVSDTAASSGDLSRPGSAQQLGSRHPISLVRNQIVEVFSRLGYTVAEGPEIEDDWHVFSALNFPPEHPARDMQDTFFLPNGNVLRTQTSAIQIRAMEENGVPIKMFGVGATYRKEMDATHGPMFGQIEGLYIDRNVTMSDLIGDIRAFLARFFEVDDVELRIRPSYFPFTDPSIEIDMKFRGDKWLEIMGAGMVHPNVLRNCGVNPDEYQGFAFGFGWDRLAMLKYGLPDLRELYGNDVRWLRRYGF